MKTGERLPRFQRRPRAIRKFQITPRDEEIIRIVARHRFITHPQIIALIRAVDPEASKRNLADRLHLLFHDNYLSRPRIQQETYKAGAGSRPMAVILGNKAIPLLVEKFGFRKSSADWTSK